MILCTARSGSTWLHTLLNSHPQIHSKGEIILENHRNQQLPFEHIAFTREARIINAGGLKVFYDKEIYEEALAKVLDDVSIKIILLYRENLLEQFVSLKLAEQASSWSHSNKEKPRQVVLDLKQVQSYVARQQQRLDSIKKELSNHEVMEMSYEDLQSNTSTVCRQLQVFLGVRYFRLRSILRKQGSKNIRDHISNWEAVKDELIHIHGV